MPTYYAAIRLNNPNALEDVCVNFVFTPFCYRVKSPCKTNGRTERGTDEQADGLARSVMRPSRTVQCNWRVGQWIIVHMTNLDKPNSSN